MYQFIITHSNNDWSLLPAHAVFSTVRPAFFMHGFSNGQFSFPAWLGNFSKQGKFSRLLKELYIRMRMETSGNKNDVRQSYIPVFAKLFSGALVRKGKVFF